MPKPTVEITSILRETPLTLTDIYEGLSDQEISFVREAVGVVIMSVIQSSVKKFPFIYDNMIAEFPSLHQYLQQNDTLPVGIRDTIIFPQYYPIFFDIKYRAILQDLLEDLGWTDGEKPFFASRRGSEIRREVLLLYKEAAIEKKSVRDAAFSASLDDILQHIQALLTEDDNSILLTPIFNQIQTLKQRAREYTSGLQISELIRIKRNFIIR